jgi:endonuclease/exonuclease/phosphatase family metal-dependent hydrolase
MRALAVLLLFHLALSAQSRGALSLRVMTYNVRYPAASDGANVWDLRKDKFVRSVQEANADIIGTQELFELQGNYLVEKLPEYQWFGLSRRGNHEDEHMGVFYRKDKLKVIESGNFWLSPTPEVPASSSWGMSLPRMATWGLFEVSGTKKRFYLVNTHFPHRGQDEAARVECAKVLAAFIGKLPKKTPVILTGDFNADASGGAFDVLTKDLKEARPTNAGGTFHGFVGTPRDARRIDWILYRGKLSPTAVEILKWNENGSYPSDHFPVIAALSVH